MRKSFHVRSLCLLLFALNTIVVSFAQNFNLVKDINLSTDSNPFGGTYGNNHSPSFAKLKDVGYFSADDGIHGRELWRSDGTAAGTYMLKDLYPGTTNSNIADLVVAGGRLFFPCLRGSSTDLWMSDGTKEGTVILSHGMGNLGGFTNVNGTLYFFENYNILWKSDGTTPGTVMLANLNAFIFVERMVSLNGLLFFAGTDFTYGTELFRSDGTQAGTYVLKDINPTGGSYPSLLTELNGKLYFSADDGTGNKLWMSDGQPDGTMVVPGGNDVGVIRNSRYFATMGNALYFTGNTSIVGAELFKYDTDVNSVALVRNIAAGSDSSNPQNVLNVNGTLFFSARVPGGDNSLWKSDGTDAGTQLVKNFSSGVGYDLYFFYNANGQLYFTHVDKDHGAEVWTSDGTDRGTHLVRDINPGPTGSNTANFTLVQGQVLFNAVIASSGSELWKSDGSEIGTSLLKDINQTATSDASPNELISFKKKLFFNAFENEHGSELWQSDGSAPGTIMSKDIYPGSFGSFPMNKTPYRNNLYFFVNADTTQLWKTTGTGSTSLVTTLPGKNMFVDFSYNVHAAENQLYFFISNYNTQLLELWRTDGTKEGTRIVKPDFPFSYAGTKPVAVIGNKLFVAISTPTNAELWKSDGTTAGTVMVKSFQPSGPFYEISDLYAFKGKVFFGADGGQGLAFWKSDGTADGTELLKQIWRPGISGYAISNHELFFDADDGVNGRQLWKTDGTSNGTKPVKLIAPYGSYPQELTNVNDLLYFTADDGINGRELWRSNGTDEGTWLVKDISPGTASTNLGGEYGKTHIIGVDGKIYFTVYDEFFTNTLLWESDGTDEGTNTVQDANLTNVTQISNLTAVGKQLFFSGYTYQVGMELYVGKARANHEALITITNPANNTIVCPPASVKITAKAYDPDGISKLSFYSGNTLLHLEDVPLQDAFRYKREYKYHWCHVLPGKYVLTIKMVNLKGVMRTSNKVEIIVTEKKEPIITERISSPGKENESRLALSPNPATNSLNIYLTGIEADKKLTISVVSASGAVIKTIRVNANKMVQMDVSELLPGVYYLKVLDKDKPLYTRFVKL